MANQHDPLDGEFLNNVFAMGILVDKNINITINGLEHGDSVETENDTDTPSDPIFSTGVNDSITQQGHRVNCFIDNDGNVSIVADMNGSGILLPCLRTGARNAPIGVAVTPGRGLGTYTPPVGGVGVGVGVGEDGSTSTSVSWICTGTFSGRRRGCGCGCSYSVRDGIGGTSLVFGHLVTPSDDEDVDVDVVDSDGCKADAGAGADSDGVDKQAANILAQTGYNAATIDQHKVIAPDGIVADEGYVFWMKTLHQSWVRRQVWVLGSTIKKIQGPHFVL